MSVDVFEAPAVAQSWFVLNRVKEIVEAEGGQMADVFKLVQYFRDLRHYPAYNRERGPLPVARGEHRGGGQPHAAKRR